MAPSPSVMQASWLSMQSVQKANLDSLPVEMQYMILIQLSSCKLTEREFMNRANGSPACVRDKTLNNRRSLVALCRVSKAMRCIAEPLLYHTCIFYGVDDFQICQTTPYLQLMRTLNEQPTLRQHIKRLAFVNSKGMDVFRDEHFWKTVRKGPPRGQSWTQWGRRLVTQPRLPRAPPTCINTAVSREVTVQRLAEMMPRLTTLVCGVYDPLEPIPFDIEGVLTWAHLFSSPCLNLTNLSLKIERPYSDALRAALCLQTLKELRVDYTGLCGHNIGQLIALFPPPNLRSTPLRSLSLSAHCDWALQYLTPPSTTLQHLSITLKSHGEPHEWTEVLAYLEKCPQIHETVQNLDLAYEGPLTKFSDEVHNQWPKMVESLRQFTALRHLRIHQSVWHSPERKQSELDAFLKLLPDSIQTVRVFPEGDHSQKGDLEQHCAFVHEDFDVAILASRKKTARWAPPNVTLWTPEITRRG